MNLFIIPEEDMDGIYNILTECGEPLASHWCSSSYYAKDDLEGRRPERQKEWKERFGDYKVLFLSEQTEEPKITQDDLLKRNKEWYDSLPENEKLKDDE